MLLPNLAKGRLAFLLPVLAGLLLALSFPPGPLPWLVFIALLPLFLFLGRSTPKRAFWGAWLAGFIFLGWSIHWFFSVLPLSWVGIENPLVGAFLVGIIWILSTALLSLFIGIFGWSWHKIPRAYSLIVGPALWIVLEYSRAWALGILWLGSESLLGPHWTFGSLGYALVNFPLLLQSSKLFGLYGAVFLVLTANLALYKVVRGQLSLKELMAVALIFVGLLSYGARQWRADGTSSQNFKRAALVQTNFPNRFALPTEQFFQEIVGAELALLEESLRHDPDLVVLPEGSGLSLRFEDKTPHILGLLFGQEKSRIIIDSSKIKIGQASPERIFYYDTVKGLLAVQDKEFLIPGGEFLPYTVRAAASILNPDWLQEFDAARGTLRGEKAPVASLSREKIDEGAILCSAILSPALWRDLSSGSSKILINPAGQALFGGYPYFYGQAEAQIRFFAASNDRWFLQAANGGFSYIIDHRGEIRAKTPNLGNQVLAGTVEYRDTKPPYIRFGDWPVLVALLTITVSFLLRVGFSSRSS